MKVLVTGASGFVGSHTVAALLGDGHQVRASARSAERVRRALAPLGCAEAVEVVAADVTDEAGVGAALAGCEAVVNAAAVYSLDPRRGKEVLAANLRGAELVLGSAHRQGLDPIVHVSSYVALLPARPTIDADSPVGRPPTPYALSKARSEELARRLQAEGAPLTIVQPGMVWGPHDPALGESSRFARSVLDGRLPIGLPGRVPVVDVRDVAAVHAAVLRPGLGPRRFLAAAELVPLREVQVAVATAAGTRPPRATAPVPVAFATGWLADRLQRLAPVRLPANYQGAWTAAHGVPFDVSATIRELGVGFRPAAETIADTVAWLREDEQRAEPAPAAAG